MEDNSLSKSLAKRILIGYRTGIKPLVGEDTELANSLVGKLEKVLLGTVAGEKQYIPYGSDRSYSLSEILPMLAQEFQRIHKKDLIKKSHHINSFTRYINAAARAIDKSHIDLTVGEMIEIPFTKLLAQRNFALRSLELVTDYLFDCYGIKLGEKQSC